MSVHVGLGIYWHVTSSHCPTGHHLVRLEKLGLLCTLGVGITGLPIVSLALVCVPTSHDARARDAHVDVFVAFFH